MPSKKPNKSGTNTGAIAGGTVGGVVCLLALGFVIWYFHKWKRKSSTKSGSKNELSAACHGNMDPEAEDSSRMMIDGRELYEMRTKESPNEAGSNPVYELPLE